ncbi:MAG: hypothetical protein EBY28_07845 [Betaproteobacteria bacterium]|nr:hypothetical protein [Betaproteobacteria bacterium]
MLRLVDMARLGRAVRQEDIDELGVTTQRKLVEAIEEGRDEDAKRLADYTIAEGKSLHDLFCDWIWDMQTQIANRYGEEAMGEILRSSQETWMLKRTWSGFLKLSVTQRVQLTAEMMRSHHGGPAQDGTTEITEHESRRSGRRHAVEARRAVPFWYDEGSARLELGPHRRAVLLHALCDERDHADGVWRASALGDRLRPRCEPALSVAVLQACRRHSRDVLHTGGAQQAGARRRQILKHATKALGLN